MFIINIGFNDVLYEQLLKMERFVISLYKICAEDGKIVVELFEPMDVSFFPNFLTDTANQKRNFSSAFHR
jgi:hypothetical protein